MSRRPRQHGVSRTARGVLVALCSAALAISAHALAGGGMPDTGLTLLLTALVGWIGAALAEKTSGPLGVLAVLGLAQLGMHLVLTELMGHPAGLHATMYLTHSLATLLTAGLLAHAESLLRLAVASLWLLLPIVWGPAPGPTTPGAAAVSRGEGVPLIELMLRRVHRRRGPPACS